MVEFHLISFMSDFNESWAGEANSEHGHRPMDNNVALILWAVLRMHDHMDQEFKHIHRELKKIMSTQAEFDQQIADVNTKLDQIGTDITAEKAEIDAFIASAPASVDTSALQGVSDRLGSIDTGVTGIFTPAP